MNGFFHDASTAALPVAVVMLVLGVTARGVLWAQIDDPRWQRAARQYLEPLSTWSVAAFIVYALTLVAAGETAVGPLAIALVLAVAAAVLRVEGEEDAPRGAATPVTASSVVSPVAPPEQGLWDGTAEPAAPGGLWARSEERG